LQASGNASLDLTNKGAIVGPLNFAAGDVALHLYTGSTMTDDLVAGTGASNTISLNGAGSGSFAMAIQNFQTIDKQDPGNWALSGVISGATSVTIDQGVLTLSGANAYTGPTTIAGGALAAGAVGTFSPASNYSVQGAGALALNGYNQTVASVVNSGLITMSASPTSPPGATLTTKDYVGAGGAIVLNAYLGADHSPSDMLVIDGGAATGATALRVINAGGAGAQTVADGIKVVNAINGATTSGAAFALGNRVAAGAYEYTLFYGGNAASGGNPNDQNWYLRDTLVRTPPPAASSDPPDPPAAPGGAAPATLAAPNYRPEVPTDMVAPMLARQFGLLMAGTLDDRLDSKFTDFGGGGENRVWTRMLGQEGSRDNGHAFSDFSSDGPSYHWTMGGFQSGIDLYHGAPHDSGSSDVAGVYVGAGAANADVDQAYSVNRAGRVQMDGYSLGGYWTHYGGAGWYTDAVLQAAHYSDIKAASVLGESLSTSGASFLASLEAGWRLNCAHGWSLTPEAQLIRQSVALRAGSDDFGHIRYGSSDAVYGRLGARVARVSDATFLGDQFTITSWARANIWRDFNDKADTTFSTLLGANPVTLGGDPGGAWVQLSLGASSALTNNVSIFGASDVSIPLQGAGNSWGGSAGIKYVW
jgi:autotransporter family porin